MSTLKQFPSISSVRALLSDEEIADKIGELTDYQKREEIASYRGEVSPITLNALANFLATLQDHYADATMSRDFSISRLKTYEELVDTVVSNERQNRYYHPEQYADIASDEIKEDA
jgi:hypothetical protein